MSKAYIVTDLSFGDAGKGTVVDYLSRQGSTVVVRHNGGPQAAHNVVTADGQHHTFAQFGSGSLVPGTRTHLSRYMLVNPLNMENEALHLQSLGHHDIWNRISVDDQALLITPWHIALNRIREWRRGEGRHGSCAQGVGETMRQSLEKPDITVRVGDIGVGMQDKLNRLRRYLHWYIGMDVPAGEQQGPDWDLLRDETVAADVAARYESWAAKLQIVSGNYLRYLSQTHDQVVFEGAQGVLLDEWFGFHPYTTWSTTTSANALQLLDEIGYADDIQRLGVIRAYTTRHGPGPFVTEDPSLGIQLPELHNGVGHWQGAFRVGPLDLVAHRYALDVTGGVDQLVVTGMDRSDRWQYCNQYDLPVEPDTERFFEPDGRRVKVGKVDDLDYQARLTELLERCRPIYSLPSAVGNGQLFLPLSSTLVRPLASFHTARPRPTSEHSSLYEKAPSCFDDWGYFTRELFCLGRAKKEGLKLA